MPTEGNEGEEVGCGVMEGAYAAHLSPEKEGGGRVGRGKEEGGRQERITSTTRSLPPIHLEDISAHSPRVSVCVCERERGYSCMCVFRVTVES